MRAHALSASETEALDHAAEILKAGRFVAAVERPDGTSLSPRQIVERVDPIGLHLKRPRD